MSIFDRFKRSNGDERTPDGSRVIRYDNADDQMQVGYDPNSAGHAELREETYGKLFGEPAEVYHEVPPLLPHIDVYPFPPGHDGRDFWTLITSGMSDQRMTFPADYTPDCPRSELVFYCDEPREDYLNLLRALAHFPHDNATSLLCGDTMPNGNPPAPLFENSPLDTLLFTASVIDPDYKLPELLRIKNDPVELLWVIPITTPECNLKLEKGFEALCELFDTNQHPFVFTGNRVGYV